MPLSDFLTVNVTTTPTAPQQAGFGVPLILGSAGAWGASTDKLRYYTSLSGLTSDGFATTDPEYLAAQAMFSQTPAPPQVAVGRRANKPTMKVVFTILQAVNGKVYSVTVNGTKYTFTAGGADTTSTIATGLNAAIGSVTGFGAGVVATNTITFTASAAGNWGRFAINTATMTPNVDIDCQQTHVDAGVAADATAVNNVDSTWYGILLTTSSSAEVAALAAWVESNGKLYLADSQDSTILGAGASDTASTLKTSAYVRSPPFYHPDNGAFFAAAMAGVQLPKPPGSENWMFVQLAGVAAVPLTATQITNLKNKNCNYYYTVAGLNISATGITPSGQWIDTVRGRDWQVSRIQNRIFTVLTSPPSAVNPSSPSGGVQLSKIPFTDQGIAVVEAEIRAALQEGINNGFLAANPAPAVTVPKASAVSTANKSSRTLAPVTFTATIAGAIDNLTITGTVSF